MTYKQVIYSIPQGGT